MTQLSIHAVDDMHGFIRVQMEHEHFAIERAARVHVRHRPKRLAYRNNSVFQLNMGLVDGDVGIAGCVGADTEVVTYAGAYEPTMLPRTRRVTAKQRRRESVAHDMHTAQGIGGNASLSDGHTVAGDRFDLTTSRNMALRVAGRVTIGAVHEVKLTCVVDGHGEVLVASSIHDGAVPTTGARSAGAPAVQQDLSNVLDVVVAMGGHANAGRGRQAVHLSSPAAQLNCDSHSESE